ncbi:MAG: DUF2927 domain-containing protein [Paracoccaceae bacterium]|nr:DUF2927 domain-containing protein [Paracoccaceae bacterium]
MAARSTFFAIMAAATLAGCDLFNPEHLSTTAPPPAEAPEPPARSADSLALERYYARIENGLSAQGLLRTDGGGPDTPWDGEDLTRNFIRIATFEEYDTAGGQIIQRQTASRIHRWEAPVRINVEFGETVSPVKQLKDTDAIERLARRLSAATGHPIRTVETGGNFTVLIVNEDERRALAPRLRQLVPSISDNAVAAVTSLPRTSYCLVIALAPRNDGVYTRAVAVIRGEHPDLLRLSCLHEEIAQGLGLSNDSPLARPSIFNDDEEFAFLTSQDEAMLSILYDDRLAPGMTGSTAAPIVETIAAEITGEGPDAF